MDPIDTVYVQEEEMFNEEAPKLKPETEKSNKTEQTIENLEQEIDKAYGVIESKFQDIWRDNSGLLKDKYHLDEHKQNLVKQLNTLKANVSENKNLQAVSESFRAFEEQLKQANLEQRLHIDELKKTANNALDALDSLLEAVENKASEYVTQFTSFFSSIVAVRPESSTPQEKEVLYSSPLNKANEEKKEEKDEDNFTWDDEDDEASVKEDAPSQAGPPKILEKGKKKTDDVDDDDDYDDWE